MTPATAAGVTGKMWSLERWIEAIAQKRLQKQLMSNIQQP
jgi:hypothetical protein